MLTLYEHSVIGDMNSKDYLRLCIILLCLNYLILKPLTPMLCEKKNAVFCFKLPRLKSLFMVLELVFAMLEPLTSKGSQKTHFKILGHKYIIKILMMANAHFRRFSLVETVNLATGLVYC